MRKLLIAAVLLAGAAGINPLPNNIYSIQVPPENIQIIHLQPLWG